MSGFVGGDPQEMTEGSRALHRTGGRIEDAGGALRDISGSSAGQPVCSRRWCRPAGTAGMHADRTSALAEVALAEMSAETIGRMQSHAGAVL